VVVPALDEAERLPLLLSDLRRLDDVGLPPRVLVVDGGSRDDTVTLAREGGADVLDAPRGRASQIRAGVEATDADWILLLHADSRFPSEAARALAVWLDRASPREAAHFGFALDGPGWFCRLIELGQRIRERVAGLVYGDQGLVLSRSAWEAVGGVPDVPIMEDVALVDRLRRHGAVRRLPARLPTSPRRYGEEGRWTGWLRNAALVTLYRVGVRPRVLARFYPPRGEGRVGRSSPTTGRPTVLLFAKAPRPGRVKTRLAADTGAAAAARLYRVMGREVADALRSGPWRLVVAYTPAGALDEVRAWLGPELGYLAQRGSDLGERMEDALARALARAPRACLVGTDAPALDGKRVREALQALDDHDLVLGPAEDGGYYLLATSSPVPELFRRIPWSTGRVLAVTLERARALGLRTHLLPALRDVDTLADVPPRLRRVLSDG
jgi:rSAM/selenodomain-associated transferase 2/rSAM/selenodomain-associated transferase 1